MRAYKVEAKDPQDETVILGTRYAGTNALAKEEKTELMEKFDLKKSDVTIEDADIPSDKTNLLEFINTVSSMADFTEVEDGEQ